MTDLLVFTDENGDLYKKALVLNGIHCHKQFSVPNKSKMLLKRAKKEK